MAFELVRHLQLRHAAHHDQVAGEQYNNLKNKKIRTVQNPIHVEAFKAFGANATPLAYNELYGALQAGVVDGADAANTNYWAQKFYEVAPNWALVSWLIYTAPVVMSEKTFRASQRTFRRRSEEKAGAEIRHVATPTRGQERRAAARADKSKGCAGDGARSRAVPQGL